MDSKIGFEMSLIVVEAIRGRCASFTVLTATVSEIFGEQANSSILVVAYMCIDNNFNDVGEMFSTSQGIVTLYSTPEALHNVLATNNAFICSPYFRIGRS